MVVVTRSRSVAFPWYSGFLYQPSRMCLNGSDQSDFMGGAGQDFFHQRHDPVYIHLANVLTDHFSNSLPEKTTKDIPMKFSQCSFKNNF